MPVKNIFPNSQIIRVKQTASTNCHLLQLSEKKNLTEGTVVVADNQTQGRGIDGNAWESEPNANICMSVILYPVSVKASEQFILSKAISLAVYDFISEYIQATRVYVKWPNDVYVDEKKITGILIENFISGAYISKTIAGIGVNINQERFFSDAPNPVSLRQLTGKTYSLEKCLHALHERIASRYRMMIDDTKSLNSDYLLHLYRLGKLHRYVANGSAFDATITGVNNYGMLEMLAANGEHKTFGFKEVKFID